MSEVGGIHQRSPPSNVLPVEIINRNLFIVVNITLSLLLNSGEVNMANAGGCPSVKGQDGGVWL